ncbi:uncharacterized protein EV420DRAFT_1651848 [Desarmillaria tabescens]|uniref:Uncharacterized protein n=1 Tax=Armillaria tabescens TaxID=1929756 RepID=A0AA39MJW4_ARMTA|nr:uncharacterized protein EV420DRAFT_1651848 [Desarmillaria tabescens]KAK0437596.1 hypothetical protein EV420DRAFT_1651848 [Desarmillaria tabescens]
MKPEMASTSAPMTKGEVSGEAKVRIAEEIKTEEMFDATLGNRKGDSKSSSPLGLKASSPGDMHHMINVSQNAMQGHKHRDTPNVWSGPAFAADQVAPNSFLGRALKKSISSAEPINTPADEPGDSDSSSSSSSSSDDESGSGNECHKRKHHKKKKLTLSFTFSLLRPYSMGETNPPMYV